MHQESALAPQDATNWPMVALLTLFHAGALMALLNFTWTAFAAGAVLWWVAGSLGIGIGYHRLLTHRGFKTPKLVEYFLAVCGSLALQGGPIGWVAVHRLHHAHSERENDPHSPRRGFWWSHFGWIVTGPSTHSAVESLARYVPDLASQPFYLWLSRWNWLPQIPLAIALYFAGGMPFVLWGIFARVVFSWHATCFVNSAGHVWGSRRFETKDDSRNNWWVAIMTFGEGWHNNHHAHPASARHGLAWYEIDLNWCFIWILKRLGLARRVRLAALPNPRPITAPQAAPKPG